MERNMDMRLEAWRLEEQDRRNRALQERMKIPRSREEMLIALASLEGLTARRRTQISEITVLNV